MPNTVVAISAITAASAMDDVEFAVEMSKARLFRAVDADELRSGAAGIPMRRISSTYEGNKRTIRAFVLGTASEPHEVTLEYADFVRDCCARPTEFSNLDGTNVRPESSSASAAELILRRSWPALGERLLQERKRSSQSKKRQQRHVDEIFERCIFAWDEASDGWTSIADARRALVELTETMALQECARCHGLVMPDDVAEQRLSCCGKIYCDGDCFRDLINSVVSEQDMTCCGGGSDVEGVKKKGHRIKVDHALVSRIVDRLGQPTAKMFHRVVVKTEERKECQMCYGKIDVPFGAEIYTCAATGCRNPRFGYCVTCDKGIAELPHRCENDVAHLLEYLAERGIMPCPECGNAAEKQDEDKCNHMTCSKCKTLYCASCGFRPPADRSGVGVRWNHGGCIGGSRHRDARRIENYFKSLMQD